MYYVGKATKIFIGVAAVLLVAGLVLGLGVFRHGLQRAPHRCDGGGCPDYPHPLPASSSLPPDSASPNGSSSSSAAAASPPATTPTNPVPPVASTEPVTAAPPPVQTPPSAAPPPALSPPIPVAAAQGPGPFLAHNRSSSTL